MVNTHLIIPPGMGASRSTLLVQECLKISGPLTVTGPRFQSLVEDGSLRVKDAICIIA